LSGHLIQLGELRLSHLSLLSLLTGLALLSLLSLRTGLRSLLAALLALGSGLRTHLAHLLALLPLATGLGALLTHLLTLLSLASGLVALLSHLLAALALSLTLAHGVELGESLAGTIHVAGAVALIVGATLAVRITLIGTVDDHAAGAVAVAPGSTGNSHTGIVGIEDHIDFAGAEGRAFGYDIIAQLVHLAFVLVGFPLAFDRAKKVGQVFVPIPHIPSFVGELLIGEIDAGKLFFELFGVEFPSGLNGRSGKYHCVGREAEGGGEEEG
jgi:hypothetical protein